MKMKVFSAVLMLAGLLLAMPAAANYPEDCLGSQQPSGGECGDITYEGCCDSLGRAGWCDQGSVFCIDCAGLNPSCGWQGEFYDCGTDGGADPSGTNPMECDKCDPACPAGQICKNGKCEVCTPDCTGKNCGGDGCGGQCGECAGQCVKGVCQQGPGCEATAGVTGCGGCDCEACVCAMDDYCCATEWDATCVGECITECGGCFKPANCGDGTCKKEELEDCANCPADCGCPEGSSCDAGVCCTPFCGGKECGDDGCGGSCGECATGVCDGAVCQKGAGCEAAAGVKGCGGFTCEACVCALDAYCCDTEWDDVCVGECINDCEACVAPVAGNNLCDKGETCTANPEDCPCGPGTKCENDVCVESVGPCEPSCDGKVCGSDGCNGSCGTCDAGLICKLGQCVVCTPDCTDMECGDDGCGGSCGECAEGTACKAGKCECVPKCTGLDCGDDGCGGSCGDCQAGFACNAGKCECAPQCDGKDCGGDGCGGSCGACDAGKVCNTDGLCECTPACEGKTCGDDGCGGQCGTCVAPQTCVDGACACAPACEGKACGDDGCGGLCGTCAEGSECTDGACIAAPVADVTEQDTTDADVKTEEPKKDSGGCTTTGTGSAAAAFLMLLALAALAVARRVKA